MSEWLDIITDPAHIAGEITFAFCETIFGITIGRFWLKRHDKKHHTKGLG